MQLVMTLLPGEGLPHNPWYDGPPHIRAALQSAQAAHRRRDASVDEYRTAIRDATRAGASYTELAAALGITRQAVRQFTMTQ